MGQLVHAVYCGFGVYSADYCLDILLLLSCEQGKSEMDFFEFLEMT